MRSRVSRSLAVLGVLACACACASPAPAEPEELDPSVAKYVLGALPSDLESPTLVDFGGKVHLVGYAIAPKDRAAPGTTLALKLYWRSVKKLSPGWKLFTRLTAPNEPKPYVFDDVGPLRESKLGPSAWVPGNIYLDEQSIAVPDTLTAPLLSLSVGLEHDGVRVVGGDEQGLGKVRLEVLTGLSDGADGALVARLPTGVGPGDKRVPRAPKRRPGKPGMDRRPAKENPQ